MIEGEAEAGEAKSRRTGKSEAAFRTISEVSEELDVPQHVLRFWESKFTQIRPLKRGGGRRYYRPEDLVLLRRIRDLLYRDGYTIRGVQKLLREPVRGDSVAAPVPAPTPVLEAAKIEATPDEEAGEDGFDTSPQQDLEAILEELIALHELLRKARG